MSSHSFFYIRSGKRRLDSGEKSANKRVKLISVYKYINIYHFILGISTETISSY